MKYPLGIKSEDKKKEEKTDKTASINYKNRGLALEKLINEANEYYVKKDIALIYKKPTPIHVVKTNNQGRIVYAYFEQKSTTDYNGIYQGRYVDFEAKSTYVKTSFPLNNFEDQQLKHLEGVIRHGGIAFVIVSFTKLNRYFVYPIKEMFEYIKKTDKKSVPLDEFIDKGYEIYLGVNPILDYLKGVDELFNFFPYNNE